MKRLFMFGIALIFTMAIFSGTVLADTVTLQWAANIEADLAGYNIYRAERIGRKSMAWEKVGTVAKDTITYTDEIDSKNYAWIVTAFDMSGNVSFPSNMVERFDRTAPLYVGDLDMM